MRGFFGRSAIAARSSIAAIVLTAAIFGRGVPATLRAQAVSTTTVWDGVYTDDQAKRGLSVYRDRCVACHGEKLDGGIAPAVVGDDFMADWQGRSVGDLFQRTQLTMPADDPGALMPADTAAVLAYIFSINKFPAGAKELPADRDALKQIRIQPQK